jgi:hypothetical protein
MYLSIAFFERVMGWPESIQWRVLTLYEIIWGIGGLYGTLREALNAMVISG